MVNVTRHHGLLPYLNLRAVQSCVPHQVSGPSTAGAGPLLRSFVASHAWRRCKKFWRQTRNPLFYSILRPPVFVEKLESFHV